LAKARERRVQAGSARESGELFEGLRYAGAEGISAARPFGANLKTETARFINQRQRVCGPGGRKRELLARGLFSCDKPRITGVSFASVPLQPKRLELLHELVPPPATIAWLREAPSFEIEARDVEAAARELGCNILSLKASSPREIDAAFATIVQSRAGALLIGNSPLFNNRRRQLAALAMRHGLPAISTIREFVVAGGSMSYGASDSDAYRRAGSHYVPRILKGAKPGDLPVEMPTKYELVINVVAAKALGLTVPPGVLAIADEVIE
jgi:putative tryptophan/tyrosine transport system substrate-binding protein